MVNSKMDELLWLLDIMIELKGYKQHNRKVLDELIQIVKYRIELLEKQAK